MKHKAEGNICELLFINVCQLIGGMLGCLSRIFPLYLIQCKNAFLDSFHAKRYKSQFRYCGNRVHIDRKTQFHNPQNVSIGEKTHINENCLLETWHIENNKKMGEIILGNECNIGAYTHITSANKVLIGDNLLTGRYVLITDNTHGKIERSELDIRPEKRSIISKGGTVIGKNVWLADKVSVMPGVTIGDGVVVAANAVVTHDIPSYCLAAGIPAKVIKHFDKQ